MRVHVVGLPHTETTRAYDWCAYTAKVRKWCGMLLDAGHEVVLYAGEENEARCTEHVPLISREEQRAWWPGWNPETDYWPGTWNAGDEWWETMNRRALVAITRRSQPFDVLGIIAGTAQQPIAAALPHLRPLEWGIGYKGVFAPFRVYESYAWMHHVAGRNHDENGQNYHVVIPNSFESEDFTPPPPSRDDYLLYMGRMVEEKGLAVVRELAARGYRIITAGQGDARVGNAEHRGLVRGVEKHELLSRARAVLVPTTYIEPFGGVAIEAMMSGTPVLTTDYGAFTETVEQGVTGFRCRTLGQFVRGIEAVDGLDREHIYAASHARFSTAAAGAQYDAFLSDLDDLSRDGWYTV